MTEAQLNPDAVTFVEYMVSWGTPFTAGNDLDFFKVAIGVLMRDAAYTLGEYSGGWECYLEIGVCSHWLRPHQTRWTADGGFAWPSGYGGSGYSRLGLPEFDWGGYLKWHPESENWRMINCSQVSTKRRFVLRAALPARTARHNQAVVNAIWIHGTPQAPRKKPMTLYGFRKIENLWALSAWWECNGAHWK